MYLREKDNLISEIEKREAKRGEIIEKVNEYVRKRYGIEDFLGLAARYFPAVPERTVHFILARHIASIKIEDVAHFLFAEWWNQSNQLKAVPVWPTFLRDGFNGANWSKMSCVKIPWLDRREGKMLIQNRKIIPKRLREKIQGMILSEIPTTHGVSLPDYHLELREKVFGKTTVFDISEFWQECLKEAKSSLPVFTFVKIGDKEVRENNITSQSRPPAHWYYPLFLSLFVDGRRILLETYENAPDISGLFYQTMEEIRKDIGLSPLVLETPYSASVEIGEEMFISQALLECNPTLLKELDWKEKIVFPQKAENNLFSAYREIAKEVIRLK